MEYSSRVYTHRGGTHSRAHQVLDRLRFLSCALNFRPLVKFANINLNNFYFSIIPSLTDLFSLDHNEFSGLRAMSLDFSNNRDFS